MTTACYTHPMQQVVAEFHRAFGMPDLIEIPGALPMDRIELRLSLIHEEGVVELQRAIAQRDTIEIIDALIDTIYVALGALVEMGQQVLMLPPRAMVEDPAFQEPLHVVAQHEAHIIREQLAALETAFRDGHLQQAVDRLSSICESAYVALTVAGFDPEPFFAEVQRSNMSKRSADGKPIYSRGMELDGYPAGKVLKGPNYSPPDLAAVYTRELKKKQVSR